MGDRTTVWVTCAASDVKAVRNAFGWSMKDPLDTSGNNGIVTTAFEGVNWGGDDQLRELAEQGIPFIACADAGCNYGEAMTAALAGTVIEVPALEQMPICAILDDGKPAPKTLALIRQFLKLRAKVVKAMAARKRKRK